MLVFKVKEAYLERFFHKHSGGFWANSHEQKGFKVEKEANAQIPTSLLAILVNSHVTNKHSFSNAKFILNKE